MNNLSSAYKEAFFNLLRNKKKEDSEYTLPQGYNRDTDTYIYPTGYEKDFNKAIKRENLFRRFGTVIDAPSFDGNIQTVVSDGIAQIVDSSEAYPESNDTFSNISYSSYKIASLSKLKNTFISDMKFDIEKYLTSDFARRFGRAEESLAINGTGVDEPTGILTSGQVGITTSNDTITADDVINLYFKLKPEYRNNAVWIMNDNTAMALRTLKDQNGNYLWRSTDDTIFSNPVVISNYMPDVNEGSMPIAFGDLSYYWTLIRKPLNVKTLTEQFAINDITGFAANERLDSKLIRPEAIKILKVGTAEE